MKIKARLILDVEYEADDGYSKGRAQADIRGLLGFVAEHAASEGLLSGDTDLLVVGWNERTEFISFLTSAFEEG